MKLTWRIGLITLYFCITVCGCKAQKPFGDSLLTLEKVIELPEVEGRIDHLSIDTTSGIVYLAAVGSNSVEAVNILAGKVNHSITGLSEPQGVIFLPSLNLIFVTNGADGKCNFYDVNSFALKSQLNLNNDADNLRYNAKSQTIYAGYGDGGIAVIDAAAQKITAQIELDGHPESFQIDTHLNKLWANIPRLNMIEVLDLKTLTVTAKWKSEDLNGNYPMAYDEIHQRLFIGCRTSAKLLVLNSETGQKIAVMDCTDDADDIFYDESFKAITVSGGGGYIDIFKQIDADNYVAIAHVPTRRGARTSLLVESSSELIVAVPMKNGEPAELRLYKLKP